MNTTLDKLANGQMLLFFVMVMAFVFSVIDRAATKREILEALKKKDDPK